MPEISSFQIPSQGDDGISFSTGTSMITTGDSLDQGSSLVHWYKTHHTGVLVCNDVVNTEESEHEVEIDDKRYIRGCCNERRKYYQEVIKVRKYRHVLQASLEDVFKSLRWVDLPGGQNRVAVERNYFMNYVWLMAFTVGEVDTTNNDAARSIRSRFEELVVTAETIGMKVRKYFKPLTVLARHHSYVEDMADLLQMHKVGRPKAEKKIYRLSIKPDDTILGGNRVDDFEKLLIYVRKDTQLWTRFKLLADTDRIEIVNKGLMDITEALKDLKSKIKRPLRILKAGSGNDFGVVCMKPSLVPHIKKMKVYIKNIVDPDNKELEEDDIAILHALFNEVESHYTYTLKFGEELVEELWDMVLMVRLSYGFIRESPLNNINAAAYDALISSKFRKPKMKLLLKKSRFESGDFFKADCPDTLRKLPIVVYPANAEMSLQ